MRHIIASTMLVLLLGCYHGPSLHRFAPAQGPEGIAADLRVKKTRIQGELLEVQDSVLLIRSTDRIVSIPVRSIDHGSFEGLGERLTRGVDAKDALIELRKLSRFPTGLSADARARLLAAYGQTTPVELP